MPRSPRSAGPEVRYNFWHISVGASNLIQEVAKVMPRPFDFVEGSSRVDMRKLIKATPAHRTAVREDVTVGRPLQPPWRTARPTRAAGFTLLLLVLAGCNSGDDESASPGPPPDDVTLTVVVVSPTEVALSWTDPSTQYAQRPQDLYSEVLRDGATLVSIHQFAFTDSGVAPGTRYCYQILVVGVYQTIFGGFQTYGWASGEICVVTPGP